MQKITIAEVAQATGGKILSGNPEDNFDCIGKDSRAVKQGMFYIAIKGENFDGNKYAESAMKNGAMGCLVSEEIKSDKPVVLVEDTIKALGKLSKYYRNKFDIPYVGITGSVGKTTTKDMIACALSAKLNVMKTQGNCNNHIGLPLTLLTLEEQNEIGVTEMGMSGFGEIDYLASLVEPETAVYTNIGLSHIENLGSKENILKAKCEMLSHLKKGGTVVLCGDDDLLWKLSKEIEYECITYGVENKNCDCFADDIRQSGETEMEFTIHYEGESFKARIPVLGDHNVNNALAAFVVARKYGVDAESILTALSMFSPGAMRQNIVKTKGITLINDCYNSSPSSVQAGLKTLRQITGTRKIAVLGDMLEMGEMSEQLHRSIGDYIIETKTDYIVAVGDMSRFIIEGACEKGFDRNNAHFFNTNSEVNEFLDKFLKEGDAVLIKASRGMELEEIVDHIIDF